MATIFDKNGTWYVIYSYKNEEGKKKQRWEKCSSKTNAKRRKLEIENKQAAGTFVIQNDCTLQEFLEEYCTTYGLNSWALSTYEARLSLIKHYINPFIGKRKLMDFSPRMINQYYQQLQSTPAYADKYIKPRSKFVSNHTIKEIHKLLRCAFNQALKWEMIEKNPFLNATVPKYIPKKRVIWDMDTIKKALDCCEDDLLALGINLSFACTLRIGELLALTWDCIDISNDALTNNCSYLTVEKELQRVSKNALEKMNNKDVIFQFPHYFSNGATALVLKKPKTETSIRRVYIPHTVAEMLIERKKQIDEYKEIFGEEYQDFNLVFATSIGRPMEQSMMSRKLKTLIRDNNLPDIVFHSLRHSSITYKLKLNQGDIKSVQGDSGHSQAKMITDTYSHILDEDRKNNATKFESVFYTRNETEASSIPQITPDMINAIKLLSEHPELMQALSSLST